MFGNEGLLSHPCFPLFLFFRVKRFGSNFESLTDVKPNLTRSMYFPAAPPIEVVISSCNNRCALGYPNKESLGIGSSHIDYVG